MLLIKNNRNPILFVVLLILSGMFFIPETTQSGTEVTGKQAVAVKEQRNPYAGAKISIKIIPSVNKTFGYDILVNERILVHQPNIPAVPGSNGFTTSGSARKVAEFVANKVRKNEMPPSVTIDDLNRMGVLK